MDILQIIITSISSLAILFILTKLMGDREMSQLSMFDYISGITIGSIAAEMATNLEEVEKPLTALLVYGVISFAISYLSCKSIKIRRFIQGKTLLLYQNGQIYEKNLLKAKIDINEFLTMCRVSGYFDLGEIHTAYLETNGKLSVIPTAKHRPVTGSDLNINPKQTYPLANVIIDGHILKDNLKSTGKNEQWLEKQLQEYGVKNIKEVILANFDVTKNNLNIYVKLNKQMERDIFV
jgi:uncharacterized membrane protein YcaP (DUF421 family)